MIRVVIFVALAFNAWGIHGAHSLELPDKFDGAASARKVGCVTVFLKSPKVQSCVASQLEGNELTVSIYDQNSAGNFLLDQQFTITSWYLMAKVDFVDLFGNGTQFIKVQFEGNSGTGILQMITMLIGWNQNHYETALFESTDYSSSQLGDTYQLKSEMKFQKGAIPRLLLTTKYEAREKGSAPISKSWKEELVWNPAIFSFYVEPTEKKKISPEGDHQSAISQCRLNFLKSKPDLKRLDIDYLEKIRITGVL